MKKKLIVPLFYCSIAMSCVAKWFRVSVSNETMKQWSNRKSQKGLTLIELLVVIAIIGVLAVGLVALIDPLEQIQKANDSKRKFDLSNIQKALQAYYEDFNKFPPNPGVCSSTNLGNCKMVRLDATIAEWGTQFDPYASVLPKDPSNNKTYIYYANTNGQIYYLYASLDREQDPQACNGELACSSLSSIGLNDTACGGICNYGVSSSNVTP